MHSRAYLRDDHFSIHPTGDRVENARFSDLIPEWSASDRIVVVAPDPAGDLATTAGLVLALTHAFYARPAAREPDFFDYPAHFVIGGEAGAQPQVLPPGSPRPWSRAWCRLDVWPTTHHAICDPSPDKLLQAVFMLEPTRLLWPERLAVPEHYALPDVPGNATQDEMRQLLRSRLRQVLVYSSVSPESPGGWQVGLAGQSRELAIDAVGLLPDEARPATGELASAAFRSIGVDDFL